MQTLAEVLQRARKLGVKCTERTFWNYVRMGLVPRGRKIPGRGNVLYYPDNAHEYLWLVKELARRIPLPVLAQYRLPEWDLEYLRELKLPGQPVEKGKIPGWLIPKFTGRIHKDMLRALAAELESPERRSRRSRKKEAR